MISFVKELDVKTAKYIRFLDIHHKRLMTAYSRRARIVVVWLDGDKKKAAEWVKANGLTKVKLAVASSKNPKLKEWKINTQNPHTVVLLNRRTVLGSYSDLDAASASRLEKRMAKHFKR